MKNTSVYVALEGHNWLFGSIDPKERIKFLESSGKKAQKYILKTFKLQDSFYILNPVEYLETGHIKNTMRPNGFLDYQDKPKHISKFLEENPDFIVIDSEGMGKWVNRYTEAKKTNFTEISEEKYIEMRDVLPPQNWRDINKDINVFFLLEGYSMDLHNCYLFDRKNKKYYVGLLSILSSDDEILEVWNKSKEKETVSY